MRNPNLQKKLEGEKNDRWSSPSLVFGENLCLYVKKKSLCHRAFGHDGGERLGRGIVRL